MFAYLAELRRKTALVRVRDSAFIIGVLVFLLLQPGIASAQIAFAPPQTYNIGAQPLSLAVSHLDNDGRPDVVVGSNDGSIRVYLNSGDGNLRTPVGYAFPGRVESLFVADLNRDGHQDIAAAGGEQLSGQLSIYLGVGNGTFQTPTTHSLSGAATTVAGGEFDRDGKVHLIVHLEGFAGCCRRFVFFRNNGSGSFTQAETAPLSGNDAGGLVVADIDNDGYLDVIGSGHVFNGVGGIDIFINNRSGGFAPPVTYPATEARASVTPVDLDGDSFLDLVWTYFNSRQLRKMHNQRNGTFRPETTGYPQQFDSLPLNEVVAGDLDLDARTDLIVPANRSIYVLQRMANNEFAVPPIALTLTGGYTRVATGDLDGDGDPDLVNLSESGLDVRRNLTPRPPKPISIDRIVPSRGGNSGTVSIRILGLGFQSGATAKLVGLGPDIAVTNLTVSNNGSLMTGSLDLRSVTPGVRALVVSNPDGSTATLPNAFTVEQGGAADIRISKTGTRAVPGRILDYFIVVENRGNVNDTNVAVTDLFESDKLELLEVNPPAAADLETLRDASAILWIIPEIPPGETKVLSYRARLLSTTTVGSDVFGLTCGDLARQEYAQCLYNAALASGFVCSIEGARCGAAVAGCVRTANPWRCLFTLGSCTFAILNCKRYEADVVDVCATRYARACKNDRQTTVAPVDPNEKLIVQQKFIRSDQTLTYPIHYENIGNAEARDVFITDVLDPNLDISTLQLLSPGATFDATTRTVRWNLLNRNLPPKGTDNVLLSIKPRPNLPSGTAIKNRATIQFEVFAPLTTNETLNIIDSTPPVCRVNPLPAQSTSTSIGLSWIGTDAVGEIDTYSVFMSVNNGAFTPLIRDTKNTSTVSIGEVGKTYRFYCTATDTVGNPELQTSTAEATTTIVPPNGSGDVNNDGVVDCRDIAIVRAAFGKRTGQAGFDARADVVKDGVIDVRDLALFRSDWQSERVAHEGIRRKHEAVFVYHSSAGMGGERDGGDDSH